MARDQPGAVAWRRETAARRQNGERRQQNGGRGMQGTLFRHAWQKEWYEVKGKRRETNGGRK